MRNLFEFYKIVYKSSKTLIFTSILKIIVTSVHPLYIYFLITLLIKMYENGASLRSLISIAVLGILIYFLSLIIKSKCQSVIKYHTIRAEHEFEEKINNIILKIDYCKLEDSDFLDYKDSALSSVYGRQYGIVETINGEVSKIISNSITVAITAWILVVINPLILLLVSFVIVCNVIIEKRITTYEVENFEKWVPLNRRYRKTFDLLYDSNYAKDIRTYNAKELFRNKVSDFSDQCVNLLKEETKVINKYTYLAAFITYIQMVVTYIYIVYVIEKNQYSVSIFPIYIGALTNFTKSLVDIGKSIVSVRKDILFLGKYFTFIKKYQQSENNGINDNFDSKLVFEFKNVYFKYPNTEQYALKNINVIFYSDKTYSIIGVNGSGKTTLIKLLQKMYKPTSGVILLNGTDINLISDSVYYSLLSSVFQDFNVFSISLEENITASSESESQKFNRISEITGINNLISDKNVTKDIRIFKYFDVSGIIPSGGQLQKIAIARALYKNSQFIVFDEATSAIDANYEFNLLKNIRKFTENRGIIFITHRLNSCKFTDQIICLNLGEICEVGSHSELYEKEGEYYNLYIKQANNYT